MKMNIIEATKKSVELNKAIYRYSHPTTMFLPTNTPYCCLMYEMNENKKRTTFLEVRWNPKQSDLLADDWLVEE